MRKKKAEKLFDAIDFANKVHRGQYRKTTPVPKIVHLIGVMELLLDNGFSDEVAIGGILHDVIEDSTTTYSEVRKKFGGKVADIVKGASEKDKSDSWEKRKEETINYLKIAPKDVLRVVCADKIDNLSFTNKEFVKYGEKVWDRFNRGKELQEWYFKGIYKVLRKRLNDKKGRKFVSKLNEEIVKAFG